VDKLPQQQAQSGDTTSTVLTTKQLLLPIRALCAGQSLLTSAEEIALVSVIKNSKVPPYVTVLSGEKEIRVKSVLEKKFSKLHKDFSIKIFELAKS